MPNQHTKNPVTALERFAKKCAFDPATGCVMWIGGTSKGHGHHVPYGQFHYEKRIWWAHRWAALHIHGLTIAGLQVDHCCPAGPSTLCVEHLAPQPGEVNRELQNTRPGRAIQSLAERRHWLFVQLGITEYEPRPRIAGDVPFYQPPAWLLPFLPVLESSDDCPF